MKKEKLLALLLVLPLAFALTGCGITSDMLQKTEQNNVDTSQQAQNGTNKTTNTDPGAIAVDQTKDDGNWKVTVHSVTVSEGTASNKPGDGNVFVIVRVSITNIGKGELSANSAFQAYGKVDDKTPVYNYASTMAAYELLDLKTLDGTLKPGDVLKGAFAMEAPKDSKVLVFRWTTGFDAELKFTIDLK
jgi:hypothetical protein